MAWRDELPRSNRIEALQTIMGKRTTQLRLKPFRWYIQDNGKHTFNTYITYKHFQSLRIKEVQNIDTAHASVNGIYNIVLTQPHLYTDPLDSV